MTETVQITITGQVQGVGFRPFIYRLARQHHLTGWVRNQSGEVMLRVQGTLADIKIFQQEILTRHPPLAEPHIDRVKCVSEKHMPAFTIISSEVSQTAQRHIPPDYFTCKDCLDELDDMRERRYRYPFINCTQCGPRYTIIHDLPYDRPNTSMQRFNLCADCSFEYHNPADRRFHAQPLACAECGPQLTYVQKKNVIHGNEAALAATLHALKQGYILAIKGIGGYHLICDACNHTAVATLRQRKHRPEKPLAVMFSIRGKDGLAQLRQYCQPDALEAAALVSPQRPIVLIRSIRTENHLAHAINPNLNQIGAMLPYSPLHYLILKDFASPLVATSANVSGEPVMTDPVEVEQRLGKVADAFLHHNRPILRPADDSVVRVIAQKVRRLRIGRGQAPLELRLPFKLTQPVLAVGGQMKNTIALAWDRRVVISPHIGELNNKRSLEVFQQVIDDLQNLYQIYPKKIICDAHPDYASTRYAHDFAVRNQRYTVLHHHAHASILSGEYGDDLPWLCFTWDGTGLGEDQTIWGGEGFYGYAGHWQRMTSIKPFYLLGGDKAAREPWRSACALVWAGMSSESSSAWEKALGETAAINLSLAYTAWNKRINTIQCSSMGRLFDAASALLKVNTHSSYEGQGPTQLETLAFAALDEKTAPVQVPPLPLEIVTQDEHELLIADWSDLPALLLDESASASHRALVFHLQMAETLVAQAQHVRSQKGEFRVGLSGGVFQNKLLSETVIKRLEEENFNVLLPEKIPYNDAGLCYGQIIEAFNLN